MTYNVYTTLNEIWQQNPNKSDWEKLLAHLGKTKPDDEPLHFSTILDCFELDDALWFLRAKSLDRLSRHFQAWCADQVLHLFEAKRPDDTRIRNQIAMLRNDNATEEQRAAAQATADDAASAVAFGSDVTSAVAWAAACAAAWDVALAAASAARASSWSSGAKWKAVRNDAQAAQEAQLRAMIETPNEGTEQ